MNGKTHRIDLEPAPHGRAVWLHEGRRMGESLSPLCAAARWLLEEGLADPDDRVTAYRGQMACVSARVGVAASLIVADRDRGGIGFEKWKHWSGLSRSAVAAKNAPNAQAGRVVAAAPQNASSEGRATQ